MAETETKATEAAQQRAEAAGLDLGTIEGTGAGGQVTAQDVDKAIAAADTEQEAIAEAEEESARAAAEQESQRLYLIKINPALVAEGTTTVTVGDRTFPDRRPVTRADFEANLKPARDTEGRQALHIDKEVK